VRWLREGRRGLDERREREQQPVARSRGERLAWVKSGGWRNRMPRNDRLTRPMRPTMPARSEVTGDGSHQRPRTRCAVPMDHLVLAIDPRNDCRREASPSGQRSTARCDDQVAGVCLVVALSTFPISPSVDREPDDIAGRRNAFTVVPHVRHERAGHQLPPYAWWKSAGGEPIRRRPAYPPYDALNVVGRAPRSNHAHGQAARRVV
jgi:hypothetical protein